jgi:ArsR family transcriptional regulator
MDKLGASQSRMSRHMSLLKTNGLVVDRRDAQWVRYTINPDLPDHLRRLIDAVLAAADAEIPLPKRKAA